ncbi:hypothetical protein [Bradyrhizobium prioriisuperbiae]|uniref:hypothetical protein n=1 Tax=Bradyrhizobium prioriisuperbiae TaxID=2854389 RepID=UPI0028E44733|nr:hypothetical protein [Bradyrhizobium prioritasuperba]
MSEVLLIRHVYAVALAAHLFCVVPAAAQNIPTDEAGFTTYVAARLRKVLGEGSVSVKNALTLSVGPLQANLDRIYSFCKASPAGCAKEVDTYVKGAAEAHRNGSDAPTKDVVRVVVRSLQYLQQARQSSGGMPLQTRPLVEGLVVVPVLDSPRTLRILTQKDSARLGLTANQIHDLALANLRKVWKPIAEIAKVAEPGRIGQLTGDVFHPSRLVLAASWAPLAKAQGGVLIVAAPVTDTVLYIGDDSPVAIDALRSLVKNLLGRAPNPLSGVMLRWTPRGWQVVS